MKWLLMLSSMLIAVVATPTLAQEGPSNVVPAQEVQILDETRLSWTPQVAALVQSAWPDLRFSLTTTPALPPPGTMLVRIVPGIPRERTTDLAGASIPQIRLALVYPDALPRTTLLPGPGQRQQVPTPLPFLLAHVIAHEIGHLFGYPHAPSGLMKADLSAADLLNPPTHASENLK